MKGFTLVETLVGAAIAAAAIAAAAEMMGRATMAETAARERWDAALLAADKAEELKALGSFPGALRTGTWAEETPGPDGRTVYLRDWAVSDAGNGLTLLEISVRPREKPGRAERMAVFVSADLGFAP